MAYKISCYSTALFSTWFFVEELGLLFDAGDGVTANLMQKSRKVKQVFIRKDGKLVGSGRIKSPESGALYEFDGNPAVVKVISPSLFK